MEDYDTVKILAALKLAGVGSLRVRYCNGPKFSYLQDLAFRDIAGKTVPPPAKVSVNILQSGTTRPIIKPLGIAVSDLVYTVADLVGPGHGYVEFDVHRGVIKHRHRTYPKNLHTTPQFSKDLF